jgi:hypothetical protein
VETWEEALRIYIEEEKYEIIDGLLLKMVKAKIKKFNISEAEIEDIKQETHLKMLKGAHWKKLYDTHANHKMIRRYVGMAVESVLKDRMKKTKPEFDPIEPYILSYEEQEVIEKIIEIEDRKEKLKNLVKKWKNATHREIAEGIIDGKEAVIIAKELMVSPSLVTQVKKKLISMAKELDNRKNGY